MNVILITFLLSVGCELSAYVLLTENKKFSQYFAYVAILIHSFTATAAFGLWLDGYSGLFALIQFFRVISIARIPFGRLHVKELRKRFGRSMFVLVLLSVISLLTLYFEVAIPWLNYIMLFSLSVAALLFLQTLSSLATWRIPRLQKESAEKLPTVSICIPARNETQDMPECIESVLQTTYPKLEILVLDDCSHDKTPAVIKEYAHQGVRFIAGDQPNEGWLGKNQAMNKLLDESTGDVIIFAGVDTRFSHNTVQLIVQSLMRGNEMLSVLPFRSSAHESSVFIQPLRYWWELSVPRIFVSRPPVLSTLWAIKRSSIKKLGEFDSYRKSVQPEAHFAKKLRERYAFIISGNRVGLTSTKQPRDQYTTAIRTRYPQLKRRVENILLFTLALSLVFVTPWIVLLLNNDTPGSVYEQAVATLVLLILNNIIISWMVVRRAWPVAIVSLHFLFLLELYTVFRSMFAYEFGKVIWKERNICLPMYKVEKQLPNL